MIRGFYAAASGLVSQQANLNIIANNLANANTTGFKPETAGFASLLYKNINGGNAKDYVGIGHGVKIEQTGINLKQGSLINTDIETDYAILGDGFFAVQNEETEELFYTRAGKFDIKVDGETRYLVDAQGFNVLNADGDAIEFSSDSTEEVDENTLQPGVYRFGNAYGLQLVGGNKFAETAISGEAEVVDPTEEDADPPKVVSGYLEGSGVAISEEMVHMIEAQRGFSFNAKIIQAADEIEKTVNQLR
ncbi:MAG: flagellar hook-basal body protein [Eubacteriales bacterium]|nr:flagellar hook-basal body protein [Eubacteriales bacterium]MDD3349965.1 flagellar hook-basal body protein [Eubacteriales bacterium]